MEMAWRKNKMKKDDFREITELEKKNRFFHHNKIAKITVDEYALLHNPINCAYVHKEGLNNKVHWYWHGKKIE